ncbi:MAG: DegT/DnrJ/EryC1/StrS family aminotransferase [Acidimicrobiia bacterium]|nr:DegT/DnrJ/EryC1/StrS family aminotransferase [Acidimicrobiia bacterium]
MSDVPFLDLVRLHAELRDELHAVLDEVLSTSAFVGSSASRAFEKEFAAASGSPYAAGCGSGTDALTLALVAAGIKPGDDVVVPSLTFVATAEAVVHAGARPVLADVDPVSLLLTPAAVDAARTDRVRAVIPVHLYGHVVPLDALDAWMRQGLIVIEDAAQAHLATWKGRPAGTVGQAGAFSFYPGKNLGALGDGGAVVSADPELHRAVTVWRDHGAADKYRHEHVGWCSRLDGLQAEWLRVKLRHLPAWTEARRRLADRYRDRLPEGLVVPWDEGAVHHLLVVRIGDGRRDDVAAGLAARGVSTGVHYPIALSEQPALAEWRRPCPVAERAATEVLSLPLDPLMTDAEVDRVCDELREVL